MNMIRMNDDTWIPVKSIISLCKSLKEHIFEEANGCMYNQITYSINFTLDSNHTKTLSFDDEDERDHVFDCILTYIELDEKHIDFETFLDEYKSM